MIALNHKIFLFSILAVFAGCRKKQTQVRQYSLQDLQLAAADNKKHISDVYDRGQGRAWYYGLTHDDLQSGKDRLTTERRYAEAIKYADRLIKISRKPHEIQDLRLEVADLLYKNKEFARAAEAYNFYADSYPGSPSAELARYKAVLARSQLILTPDRDTAAAQETIEHGTIFLESEKFITYRREVQRLVDEARRVLYRNSLMNFYFYFERGHYKAAQTRLNDMKERYLIYLDDLEPEILVAEYKLAKALNDIPRVEQVRTQIVSKYPQLAASLDDKDVQEIFAAANTNGRSTKKPDYTQRF